MTLDETSNSSLRARLANGISRRWLLTARGWLGTLADAIAVVTAAVAVWSLATDNAPLPQAILAFALGALALVFMGLSFHLQRQQARELAEAWRRARHADSLQYMTESAEALRDGMANLSDSGNPASFEEPATRAVTSLAQTMTVAVGSKCRAVVKIIYAPEGRDDVAVRTFASSEPPGSRRGTPASIDWVKENTDFDEIFYHNRDFFLSNDLSAELGYKNSHFTRELLQQGYPYKSTIVWPIYGYVGGNANVLGFLCVDTKSVDAFDEDHDVVVGKTMAFFWYLALERYTESVEQADEASGPPKIPVRNAATPAKDLEQPSPAQGQGGEGAAGP